jgi:hypothetical protein
VNQISPLPGNFGDFRHFYQRRGTLATVLREPFGPTALFAEDFDENGAKSDRPQLDHDRAIGFANKRAEIWGSMRAWLDNGAIDNDPELIADLTGVEYGYVLRDGRDAIQLERKEDMKRRGLASPDNADALALTFAYPVLAPAARSRRPGRYYRSDYNPLAWTEEEKRVMTGRDYR